MRSAVKFALVAVSFVTLPLPAWTQQQVHVPVSTDPNYSSIQTNSDQPPPSGYEGHTDNSTRTFTGKTAATDGRVFVEKFNMSTAIKRCPHADGNAEGDGLFTVSIDYKDKQGNIGKIAMTARAQFKGTVDDNALIEGPVKADVDYSYTVSGRFPDQNGVIFSPTGLDNHQHVTLDVGVVPGLNPPTLSNFKVRNLDQTSYSTAIGAAAAVSYWGGVYFGIAEYEWREGGCVYVVFDPPSNTIQAVPNAHVKVKAQVKSKDGGTTKANFSKARPYGGSSISPRQAYRISERRCSLPSRRPARSKTTPNRNRASAWT